MSLLSSVRPLVVALVLAAAVSACTGGDDEAQQAELTALRDEVAELVERDAQREEQLQEAVAATKRLAQADPLARLRATDEELMRLTDALTVLEADLAAAVSDGTEADQELSGATSELREQHQQVLDAVAQLGDQLDAARGRIDTVGGEVDELRTLFTTLRDRLDRLQRGG